MTSSRIADPQMPTGKIFDERGIFYGKVKEDPRYKFARSCVYCSDTADSLNRYVSTYCHLRHQHLAGFGDCLDECRGCMDYRPRKEKIA